MRGFGSEELGGQVSRVFVIGVAPLAGLAVFELGMGWKEALMVSRAAKGLFADSLVLLAWIFLRRVGTKLTGSNVGLCAVVMAKTLRNWWCYNSGDGKMALNGSRRLVSDCCQWRRLPTLWLHRPAEFFASRREPHDSQVRCNG